MATSGSYDFDRTCTQIIARSLRILGALGQGDTPEAEQLNEGREALNAIVKNIQKFENYALWAREWTVKSLSASSEVTGTDSNIYTCTRGHTSASANMPITGANWEAYWRLDGDTGGTWVTATAYSAIGDFAPEADTLWIENAFVRRDTFDHPIEIIAYADYFEKYTAKYTTGLPCVMTFNSSLDDPRVYTYPQSDDTSDLINYLRYRKLEDFDALTNNPDSPSSWLEVLAFALAGRLAYEYGIGTSERRDIQAEASRLLAIAKRGDREITSGSNFISPAY